MPTKVVVGAQWGDEGKGKIIDILASKCDIVVRCQGGNNAGHTVKHKDNTYTLRCIPSGILFENVSCYISSGVVLNPQSVLLEIEELKSKGVNIKNLKIDPRVHVIMPWHVALDEAYEISKGENNIGTTKKGIGPCYEDKMNRCGIRLHELIDKDSFTKKALNVGNFKNKILEKIYNIEPLNINKIVNDYVEYGEKLKPFIEDTCQAIYNAYIENKHILFEGAQGSMLDINYGTYPFVTSSNPISGGICTGAGIAPTAIDKVLGVAKAYTTRVGGGPLPTAMNEDLQNIIIEKGAEFGTNTKRRRRIGWLDAVALRYSKIINGFNTIALNKLDILSGIGSLKICTAYKTKQGNTIKHFPWSLDELAGVTPIYEEFEGFNEDISMCRTVEDLPLNCKKYILGIERLCNIKISMIGTGPKRHENIYRDI